MTSGRVVGLFLLAFPVFGQYLGPAILTRGEAPAGMTTEPDVRFRPFVAVMGLYQSGLAGVAVTDTGDVSGASSYGVSLSWGVGGTHNWKHTKLGMNYFGSLLHYSQQTQYDSLNQSIMLGVTHDLSRHVSISLRENAGIYSRLSGLPDLRETVPFDPSTTYAPTTDFFDNRTIFASSQIDMVIQKSARLSFDMGGDVYTTQRRSHALYDVTAAGARGDVQYRLTRRTTVGANYRYQHDIFSHIFGGTDIHMFAGSYSVALSRLVEFTGYAGVARVESKFIRQVPIDPAVAAFLGVSSGAEIAHTIGYAPVFGARLSRTFREGVAFLAAGRSISAGNGLFLTSTSTSVLAGYSYTGIRRWSFNARAGYYRSKSLTLNVGQYNSLTAGVGASRQVARSIHAVFQYSARYYQSNDFHNYNRVVHSVSVGAAFSPGDSAFRF